MIELALQGKAPRKRTTTVRTTFKPRAPEGKARPLTAAESRKAIFQKLDFIRSELQDQLKGFHERYTGLARDLKESARQRDFVREALSDFGTRLAAVEKQMKVAVTTFTREQMKAAGLIEPEAEAPPGVLLVAWEERIRAAVERLKELPDPCTPMQVAAHFRIPYSTLQKLWLRGQLPVTRERKWITIRREDIAAYVNNYGVPCRRWRRTP